ncbi:MAG TPA: ATP-binding protein [Chloroflexota bacterium]|nr:ATP-binding protein [Chloroflexota bacterium]
MTRLEEWQQGNDDFLAAALAWLRLRLRQRAASEPIPVMAAPAPSASMEPANRWRLRRPASETAAETDPLLLPPPANGVTEEQIAQAAANMAATGAMEPPPALYILSQRLGLSPFERDLLLLCAALELDTRLAGLCALAQDDPARPYPTFALALALFDEPAWEALSPERPLRYWRLIEINQPGAQPLTTSALRADERIVNYLKGLNYLDDRLAPLFVPFDVAVGVEELPDSQATAVHLAAQHLQQGVSPVQLVGADPLSQQMVAQAVAAALDLHLYRLPVELLPAQAGELETLARLWQRESILLPVALYLDAQDVDGSTQPEASASPAISALHRFLARSQGPILIGTRDMRPGLGAVTTAVEVDKPTPAEQQVIWAEALSSERLAVSDGRSVREQLAESDGRSAREQVTVEGPALLAGQFNLNGVTIHQIVQRVTAQNTTEDEEPSSRITDHGLRLTELWDASLLTTRPRLDVLAQRLDTKATWDDIVLPNEELILLRQIADQVRQRSLVYDEWGFRAKMNRGLGINALFAGESGTGKTMAAEVIANELRLNLYRIDLSAVVSKYIGETEKNLRRLFDAAEDGGAILFFDEADALFGKRSEVKDSHDRYANIEINYLLQRMESYRGLAILATNMKSALDSAFMRRLRFIVNFPFPGPAERQAMWTKVFPPQTQVVTEEFLTAAAAQAELGELERETFEKLAQEKVDMARLARLNLTGGNIHNVALNAAFLAAQAGTPVTMSLILSAARSEFRKLGRPLREVDFQ